MAHEELKERIVELEAQLKGTKVNKKTEMAVGQMKAKISKLKEELEIKLSSGGSAGEGFAVKKEGDATVGFLGKPSVGKSTLLGACTNKESKIGAYEFTTLDVIPGLLHFKHTNLQLLDLPGIIDKAADNRGFGKKVLSVVRACDLVVFVLDARFVMDEMEMLINETYKAGLRFNSMRPNMEINRTHKGGVSVPLNNSKASIPYSLIEQIMADMKLVNVEVIIHERKLNVDDFIDACYGNLQYSQGVICINKLDLLSHNQIKEKTKMLKKKYPGYAITGVSADKKLNLEGFKNFVWDQLGFMHVYLKERKGEPDFEKPLVVERFDNVKRVCEKIHRTMFEKFRFAKIKGDSVKFDWQQVGLEHMVEPNDIIEIFQR
ncbi:MAG: 50S ribosome-binding GTPase [Nanoarchaeales archaeon]|nr:50S ribosome-binding GTPase [Nanoarchaeales archaeon]